MHAPEKWSVEIPQDPSDWMARVGKFIDTPGEDAVDAATEDTQVMSPERRRACLPPEFRLALRDLGQTGPA